MVAAAGATSAAGQPDLGPNLASPAAGAAAVEWSSVADGHSADEIADSDPTTAWVTAPGQPSGQYVTVRLATDQPVPISAVAITAAPPRGVSPAAALKTFELSVSERTAERRDLRRVLRGECPPDGRRQVFTFAPVPARYVRLRVRSNHGDPSQTAVAELEVYADPAASPYVPLERGLLVDSRLTAPPRPAAFTRLTSLIAEVPLPVETTAELAGEAYPALTEAILARARVVLTGPVPARLAEEDSLLRRFLRRGGGVVYCLPADPSASEADAFLSSLGLRLRRRSEPRTAVTPAEHWVSAGATLPGELDCPLAIESDDADPILSADGAPCAVAARVTVGRIVVLPLQLAQDDAAADGEGRLELARRAVVWAAGMDYGGGEPVPGLLVEMGRLEGMVLAALGEPDAASGGTSGRKEQGLQPQFAGLLGALRGAGLVVEAGRPEGLPATARLAGADLVLLHVVRPLSERAALSLQNAVEDGLSLMVLAGPAEEKHLAPILAVNDALRETGIAVTLGPEGDGVVELPPHPASDGLPASVGGQPALSRPGQPVNVWSVRGEPLATSGGRTLALAQVLGEGRIVVLDGGLAQDPPPPRDGGAPPLAAHLGLAGNRLFVLRCVAWLLRAGANAGSAPGTEPQSQPPPVIPEE